MTNAIAPRQSSAIAGVRNVALSNRKLAIRSAMPLRYAFVCDGFQRTAASRKGAAPLRWNPEPENVQRSVAQLVLTIVEFLRRLMERQAIRRMEQKTLTRKEVEAVGEALMKLEETIRDIGLKFGLTPEDLNLDLGPLGKLM